MKIDYINNSQQNGMKLSGFVHSELFENVAKFAQTCYSVTTFCTILYKLHGIFFCNMPVLCCEQFYIEIYKCT